MSRILVWSPNYSPELTGIPPLVTDACRWLAVRGHEVEVVTALPNYPQRRIYPAYRRNLWRTEVLDGVRVHRSWIRVRPGESFVDKVLYEASLRALDPAYHPPRTPGRRACLRRSLSTRCGGVGRTRRVSEGSASFSGGRISSSPRRARSTVSARSLFVP